MTPFLPYDGIVERLEQVARSTAGATVVHRGGLAVLRLEPPMASTDAVAPPDAWIQAGIHPCEWIGPAVALRIIEAVVQNERLRRIAVWHFAPVVDADGYRRTWNGERFLKTVDTGENANLNFPHMWRVAPPLMKRLLSRRLEQWTGPQPESAACVRTLCAELRSLTNLQLFLDLHGFGRFWLYPWCHTRVPAAHRAEHLAATTVALAAANRIAGTEAYRSLPAAALEAPMGGTSVDFAYGDLGCVHSYVVELPPAAPRGGLLLATIRGLLTGDPKRWWREGMNPPATMATAAGNEMAAALEALALHVFAGGGTA